MWLSSVNPDVAWLLYAAGRVLDGQKLYVDIIETNPPLIVALMAGVEWIARGVGAPAIVVVKPILLAMVALSLVLSWRLAKDLLPSPLRQLMLLLLSFALLSAPGCLKYRYKPNDSCANWRYSGVNVRSAIP